MKKRFALLLAILLVFAACVGPAACFSAKAGGIVNFDVSKIASYFHDEEEDEAPFETVLVASAEECLNGVPLCDDMWVTETCYVYGYTGCGKEENGHGRDDMWALFKTYVEVLVETGGFQVTHYDLEGSFERWALSYIGPGTLPRPFSTGDNAEDEAITVISTNGDVHVWYSRDIHTADLAQTMIRLDLVSAPTAKPTQKPTQKPTPKPTAKPSGKGNCEACGGDGKCDNCGGDMWFEGYKYVWNSRTREYDNKYVRELCRDDNCHGGSCKTCGGDGWV